METSDLKVFQMAFAPIALNKSSYVKKTPAPGLPCLISERNMKKTPARFIGGGGGRGLTELKAIRYIFGTLATDVGVDTSPFLAKRFQCYHS